MKDKILKRTVSVVLSIMMIFSMTTVGLVSVSAAKTGGGIPGMGVVKTVGGRMFQEFTSYCISNDVPYLSDTFYYVLCNPSQRSSIKTNATVQQINKTVNEINQKMDVVLDDLCEIQTGVEISNTQQVYIDSKNDLDNYWNDNYKDVWNTYELALQTELEIDEKLQNGSKTTDPDIIELQKKAEKYMNSFVSNYKDDIVGLSDNAEGYDDYVYDSNVFTKEMDNFNDYIVSYLVASENYLRSVYPYEHEITENMYCCFQYCLQIESKVYQMHKAFSVYSDTIDITTGTSTCDEIPDVTEVTEFTEETTYFENLLRNQLYVTDIHNFMVTEEFLNELKSTLKEGLDKEYNPPVVETTTSIGGKEVPCYKIRDNKSLDYFLITQQSESLNSSVSSWKNGIGETVYRPNTVLNEKYTDDGQYKMISSLSEMPSLNGRDNLLNYLRSSDSGLGFTKISQNTNYIILDNCSYNKNGVWNMQFVLVNNPSDSNTPTEVVNMTSDKVYQNSQNTFIRIYRSVTEDKFFNSKENKCWKVSSIGDVPSTISLHDGQTLDLSIITESPKCPTTIIASGECTIIGNPDVTFNNVNIIIDTDEQVTIKNLNTKCTQYGTPIEVKSKDSKIKFEGENTFTGYGGYVNHDIYTQYDFGNNPVGTSQGMLIDSGCSVTITGDKVSFYGDCGGSGICTCGDLTIDGLDVVSVGSYKEVTVGYMDVGYDYSVKKYCTTYSVGSGIGASVSYVNQEKSTGQTYTSYGQINIINGSNVTAKGVMPDGKDNSYSMDIGGVVYANGFNYGSFTTPISKMRTVHVSGNISNSTISTENGNIDSKITYSNSKFDKDQYTITTVTSGSDGVTDKGISVKVHGKDGETDWMKCSNLGDSKGEETLTVTGSYVGEIEYIEVKINSGSNSWYPEKITVKSQIGNDEVTFYGGKWINENETYTLTESDNVIEVTIKTGDLDNSGTDCGVRINLVDSNGVESGWINLSEIHPDKNAFEKGDKSTFYISVPSNFGKVQYVELKTISNSTAASDWYIDDITVTQVQGTNKGDTFTVNCDQWDVNDHVMSFGRETGKIGTFDVEIKTSNSNKSGTDADLYLKLIGTNGSTDSVLINKYTDSYTSGTNYEKGDTDKFRITFDLGKEGLGQIKGIEVINKGGGSGPDWKVEYIKVTEILPDGTKGSTYQFNINEWINSGETYTKYL